MEFVKPGIDINFMGVRKHFLIVSGTLVLLSLILIGVKGLNYGIDFAGGVEVRLEFEDSVNISDVRKSLKGIDLQDVQVQQFIIPQRHVYTVKAKGEIEHAETMESGDTGQMTDIATQIFDRMKEEFGEDKVSIVSTDMVGPRVGGELRKKGLLAIVVAMIAMLVYIGYRFDYKFAPGAVTALIHDVILTVGLFVLLNKEFDLTVIAALLTIAGYSINDTIVVFDRIREGLSRLRKLPMPKLVNTCVNETLSRTILTSLTTLFTVTALFVLGGEILKDFAFAMICGVIVGTYSSIFIAASTYLSLDEAVAKRKRHGR